MVAILAARPDLTSLRAQGVARPPVRAVPKPAPGIPPEPAWHHVFGEDKHLCQAARYRWRELCRELRAARVPISRLERETMAQFVIVSVRIAWLESQIGKPTHDSDRGDVKNALFSPLNQYRTHQRAYMTELGLTPVARAKMTLPEDRDDSDDDLNGS